MREQVNTLQERSALRLLADAIETETLEKDNAAKEKELAKLNKSVLKSKSKKEALALLQALISLLLSKRANP